MTTATIMNQLIDLRLSGMRETIANRLKQARTDSTNFEEFFAMLLQDETDFRRTARIKRLVKQAAFRQPATLEAIDLSIARGLDKALLKDLNSGRFLLDGINVIIMGPTGVGKSYLATAIGNSACRAGHSTVFYRMNALIEQITLARSRNTYLNLLKRLSSTDLLILDDFGIKPLNAAQYQDLFDVLDERGEERSTIITTQLPIENWNEVIPDPVSCEAITDRLTAVSIPIIMKGISYRPKRERRAKS